MIPWHFSFGAPYNLLALLVVPPVLALAGLGRRRARFTAAFPNMGVLEAVLARRARRTHSGAPAVLLGLALVIGLVAIARPRVQLLSSNRTATVILLIDVSDSMQARDVVPSRLSAAVAAIQDFLNVLPAGDRVGLVTFSDSTQIVNPPTTDRTAIRSSLDVLSPEGGTALGDAVETSVKLAVSAVAAQGIHHRPGQYLPAAIVLESDGAQNRGVASPFQAGNLAKAAGVRIYGIALGRRDAQIIVGSGFSALKIPVPPDPGAVGILARDSGGQSYNAPDSGTLDDIYKHLGKTIGTQRQLSEVTWWLELAAAVFLVAGVLASRFRGGALP